jgi:transposase
MVEDRTTHTEAAPSKKGGRTRVEDRRCFEDILWVLRSGARWKDLPERYPSPATCWRRLQEWEDAGVCLDLWRKFLGELDEEGILSWGETFSDGTFSTRKKRGADVGKTKRGKGTKLMVVADGRGVALGVRIAPASPAEVTLIESTLEQVAVPRSGPGRPRTKPRRLIYHKASDSDALRLRLKKRGIESICPHRSNRKRPTLQDGRSLRRYRRRWTIERTVAWLGNFRRLVVRYERKSKMFLAFLKVACLMITLRQF